MSTRSPNHVAPSPPGFVMFFQPHEYRMLKRNQPGLSGALGGYQRHENWLIEHTDPATLRCELPPQQFERTVRFIKRYGKGGPNRRIRDACIPALRRAGVDLQPEWRAPV
jgi:hypothetical protein